MPLPDPVLRTARCAQRGAMLVAIIFFMVIGGALAAAVLAVSRGQNVDAALDIMGARAYWAARSGIEWGTYQVMDPTGTASLPDCFGATTLSIPGDVFSVDVSCTRTPSFGASPNYVEEQTYRVVAYQLVATAWHGAAGSPDRVERTIESKVMKCRNPGPPVAAC